MTSCPTGSVFIVIVVETAGEVTLLVCCSDSHIHPGSRTAGGTGSILEDIVTQRAVIVTILVDS
jgi:hypothetical protein